MLALSLVACAESPSTSKYDSVFQSCRGFDFDKKFPGKYNRPEGVNYDDNQKRLYGEDGLSFHLFLRHPNYPNEVRFYNSKDLELSAQEKEYIANFDKLEEEFDRKYAGEIKKKLQSVSKLFTRPNGKTALAYPRYLEGEDALPDGVETPASIFSYNFIIDYIEAKNHPGDLREFILSTELYHDSTILDLAAGVGANAAGQVFWRLRSLYADYILTSYNLKHYDSLEQRHQTVLDFAEYYSEVAFRGAAESLYHYRHILTGGQRCRIANYVAERLYELVMVMDDPERLRKIKRDYEKEISLACKSNIEHSVLGPEQYVGKISKEELSKLRDELNKRIDSGEKRCVND